MPSDPLVRLRRQQAKRVMPLIGGLLDAYEQLPNDVREELGPLGEHLDRILEAMEGETNAD